MSECVLKYFQSESAGQYSFLQQVVLHLTILLVLAQILYHLIYAGGIIHQLLFTHFLHYHILHTLLHYVLALQNVILSNLVGKSETSLYYKIVTRAWHKRMRASRLRVVI